MTKIIQNVFFSKHNANVRGKKFLTARTSQQNNLTNGHCREQCEPIVATDLIGQIKFQNATAVCAMFRCMTLAVATRDAGGYERDDGFFGTTFNSTFTFTLQAARLSETDDYTTPFT